MARRTDPYKHKSRLTANAVLIRTKAERIDSLVDDLLQRTTSDLAIGTLTQVKIKALGIVDLIEKENQ